MKRLEQVPAYLAQVIQNLRAGLAAGRTPPRIVLGRVVEQARAHYGAAAPVRWRVLVGADVARAELVEGQRVEHQRHVRAAGGWPRGGRRRSRGIARRPAPRRTSPGRRRSS